MGGAAGAIAGRVACVGLTAGGCVVVVAPGVPAAVAAGGASATHGAAMLAKIGNGPQHAKTGSNTSFTRSRSTVRDRMERAGTKPADMKRPEAHHDLPWEFKPWFNERGLDPNDPKSVAGSKVRLTVRIRYECGYTAMLGRYSRHETPRLRWTIYFVILTSFAAVGSFPRAD